jgi:hypothetical protein
MTTPRPTRRSRRLAFRRRSHALSGCHGSVREAVSSRRAHACEDATVAPRLRAGLGLFGSTRRRGSTLMIVIVLLGLLSVLGVLFYTFAAQERSNAEYYAEGGKADKAPGLTADELMDVALEQLLFGPDVRKKNSALWGSRHSLLPNALGVNNYAAEDHTEFDGQGVHLGTEDTNNNGLLDPPGTYDLNGDGTLNAADDEDANANGTLDRGFVDQDRNRIADTGLLRDASGGIVRTNNTTAAGSDPQDLLNFNDSPAANNLLERDTGSTDNQTGLRSGLPQPDVGYTYPDINNVFLAYIGWTRDSSGSGAPTRPVIIPSFHRPQLLRNEATGAPYPAGLGFGENWYDFTEDRNHNGVLDMGEDLNGNSVLDHLGGQLMRPHPEHVYVAPGTQPVIRRRYILDAADAATFSTTPAMTPFPFQPMMPNGYATPANWIGHQGIWSGPHPLDPTFLNPTPAIRALHDEMQLDVDNDGDGIREGIWVDLDFPVQEDSNGEQFVPLFSLTVVDLEALLNLNAHGNVAALWHEGLPLQNNAGSPYGNGYFVSRSNLGRTPSEVNPVWALTGRPGVETAAGQFATAFTQHRLFYGANPFDAGTWVTGGDLRYRTYLSYVESGNMELTFLKLGRPELDPASGAPSSTINDLYAGLFGEERVFEQNISLPGRVDQRMAFTSQPLPRPGLTGTPESNELNASESSRFAFNAARQVNNTWLDTEHPQDYIGIGSFIGSFEDTNNNAVLDMGEDLDNNGRLTPNPKALRRQTGAGGRLWWPKYSRYYNYYDPMAALNYTNR